MRRAEPPGRVPSGKRANGALEADVLGVLWSANTPLTPAQVQQALADGGIAELAYTTVATTLNRLLTKGQVRRQPTGRGHAYTPTRGAAQHAAALMRDILDGTPGGDRGAALQHFLTGLDRSDVAAARALLAQPADPTRAAPPPSRPRRRTGR